MAENISKEIGSKVIIDKVNLGFLNRFVADDVVIYDKENKEALRVSRLAARIDIPKLLKGKTVVSSAQLFGLHADIYKKTPEKPLNIQFILDSLSKESESDKSSIDLRINSLIVRNGSIYYNEHYVPETRKQLNLSHIKINNLSAHIVVNKFSNNDFDVKIKRLSMNEHSGLDIKSLLCHAQSSKDGVTLNYLTIELPSSKFKFDNIEISTGSNHNGEGYTISNFKGRLSPSNFNTKDFRFLSNKITEDISLNAKGYFAGNANNINIRQLSIYDNQQKYISYEGDISVKRDNNKSSFGIVAQNLSVGKALYPSITSLLSLSKSQNDLLSTIGDCNFAGNINKAGNRFSSEGILSTEVGTIDYVANIDNKNFAIDASFDEIDLHKLTRNDELGEIGGSLSLKGIANVSDLLRSNVSGDVKIDKFQYKSQQYSNISIGGEYRDYTFDGYANMDDLQGKISVLGKAEYRNEMFVADISGQIQDVNINILPDSKPMASNYVSGSFQTNVKGKDLMSMLGSVNISDFSLRQPDKTFNCNSFNLNLFQEESIRHIDLSNDYFDAHVSGIYDYKSLVNSFKKLFISKIPTLAHLTTVPKINNNDISIDAEIKNADFIKLFSDKTVVLNKPIMLEGKLTDDNQEVKISCVAPDFYYENKHFINALLDVKTLSDTLKINGTIQELSSDDNSEEENRRDAFAMVSDLQLNSMPSTYSFDCSAVNNKLLSAITFDKNGKHRIRGNISATTDFYSSVGQEKPVISTIIHTSTLYFDDEKFQIEPSDIVYHDNRLLIDYFAIANKNQQIIVSGFASDSSNDTIKADIKNINVDYLSGLLNVNGVEFSGTASGKAQIVSLLNSPKASAKLDVENFKFVGGTLGNMSATADWSEETKRIDIKAICNEDILAQTLVNGYVSPAEDKIDLKIETRNTSINFLEHYIGSFMSNIKARADGELRVFGLLSDVNLEGRVVANGDVSLLPLSTTYTMKNDVVSLYPNRIVFSNDSVVDDNGKVAVVNGAVTHESLKNFAYNITVSADNVKAFDKPNFNDDTFCGTIYATGECRVVGGHGETSIDVDAIPEEGSIIRYNADGGGNSSQQTFIRWRDKQDNVELKEIASKPTENYTQSSDLRMNFHIDANPNLTLQVILNEDNGDYINLRGRGMIQAHYFNKGTFEMYGNYLVDDGAYKMTIQNLITKDFLFREGSMIVFNGNPFDASLGLNAVYPLSSVSLADLNIGNSFSSNNVKVNCLMNITGTPLNPIVDFDFEMPNANTNVEQMVRSLINSEEELNQQVIYLLTIGRFYGQGNNSVADDAATQSQTSLAMQSLLSGTISQQINNALSSVLNLSNWNFGANISGGSEGWNNAEYEGVLSGRLFNNRLIINGQFGYRDNNNATTSFIGDFDIRYLLFPNGNLALKVYNQSNDRYFTRNSLNTQGIGLIVKKDFNSILDIFRKSRKVSSQIKATSVGSSENALIQNESQERVDSLQIR